MFGIFKKKRESLVVCADIYSQKEGLRLIDEIRRLDLEPGPLSEVFREIGRVGVVLANARKGTVIHVLPKLREAQIPLTLFVDPNLVGSNRLSLKDEIQLRRLAESFDHNEEERVLSRVQSHPEEEPDLSKKLRLRFGVLPIDRLDPLIFPAMWRDLARETVTGLELGVIMSSDSSASLFGQRLGKMARFSWGKAPLHEINPSIEFSEAGARLGEVHRACRMWTERLALRA